MKKISILLIYCILSVSNLHSQTEDWQKYVPIIQKYVYQDYKQMFREKGGNLQYPFIVPGSAAYHDQLWDWDSWLTNIGLRQILLDKESEKDKKEAFENEKGCVLNFLSIGDWDGWLPGMIHKGSTKELRSMIYLNNCLGLKEVVNEYEKDLNELKDAIQEHCWDERDGFFYSVDLNLLPVTEKPSFKGSNFVFHSGYPRDYDCLIQRIEVWSGFMAMWAGIASPEQAKRIVNEHFKNPKTYNSPYGVRSLSKMEKMYSVKASGNPSNWLGPIWGISNYMVFKGLANYGFDEEAKEMASKTIILFGKDYEKTGVLHEFYVPESGNFIMNPGFQN